MGPFKCPDCGVWWAGVEHRCKPAQSTSPWPLNITVSPPSTTYTMRCTCSFDEHGRRIVSTALCALHDVQAIYTTWSI